MRPDSISIEWLSPTIGLVRHHPVGGFGAPYDFVCTLVLHDGSCEIKAALGVFSPRIWSDLRRDLRRRGVRRWNWERHHGERVKIVDAFL